MDTELKPVAFVHSSRVEAVDDDWDAETAWIELAEWLPDEALEGTEGFSHIEVLYRFHKADKAALGLRRPRGNPAWPEVGIFAQRGKDRPNHLGLCACRLVAREGRRLRVAGLDAIDGSPVLDIKPVFRAFLPRGEIREPAWVAELSANYWRPAGAEEEKHA
jgi:tRNA-Thr(GGU) m(6)t(6)A37 methyltransferase TsaA